MEGRTDGGGCVGGWAGRGELASKQARNVGGGRKEGEGESVVGSERASERASRSTSSPCCAPCGAVEAGRQLRQLSLPGAATWEDSSSLELQLSRPGPGRPASGLAGSRGVADPRPATRDPGRNKRPATLDPERPGRPDRPGHFSNARPGPGICQYKDFKFNF